MSTPFELLPILNHAPPKQDGNCGGSCSCSQPDDEFTLRLKELETEMSESQFSPQTPRNCESTGDQVALFSKSLPLPLVNEISHHEINGKHLFVGVNEAAVIVLNEDDSTLMVGLLHGIPPEHLARTLSSSTNDGWSQLYRFIGRLAEAGFLKGFRGLVEHRPSTPEKFSRFHLTQACHLECVHCYANSSPHVDRSRELSTERWIKLATEFVGNGGQSVLFTGGEALMHPGCLDIMASVKNAGAQCTLFTNGILVPRYASEIHALADLVQVSLDGPDAESNDPIRGTNTFSHIIRAIDTLVTQGTPTKIGMTVMLQNWSAWKEKFLQFAERYRGTSVEFRLSFGLTHYGRAEQLPAIAVQEVQPVAAKFMEAVNGSAGPKITRVTKSCGYCEQLVVGPDGTVYPCHLLDAPISHVDHYTVPRLIQLLKHASGKFDVDHVDGCNTCDIRYLCGGTCRVVDRLRTGSRFVTSCTPQEKDRKLGNLVRTYS